MEDLLWNHPDKLLNEQLRQFRRQPSSRIGRADLVFKDRLDRFIVIEIKRGTLPRDAIAQLHDYYGMLKEEFPDRPVELMAVANDIPKERRLACEQYNIEPREISQKRFRDVANEVGYSFQSEQAPAAVSSPLSSAEPRASNRNLLLTTAKDRVYKAFLDNPSITVDGAKAVAPEIKNSSIRGWLQRARYDFNRRNKWSDQEAVKNKQTHVPKGMRDLWNQKIEDAITDDKKNEKP